MSAPSTTPTKPIFEGFPVVPHPPPASFVASKVGPSVVRLALPSVQSSPSLFEALNETEMLTGVGPVVSIESEKSESEDATGMPGA